MDEMEQAQNELDRLQGIITRHEDHMFALRGWLLAIVGALLAAYYTANIDLSGLVLRLALFAITLLFFVVESRHLNLVEAVVERASAVENKIAASRNFEGRLPDGWYDGPKVSVSCKNGAERWWPRSGMTFLLNLPFYCVVIVIIVVTTISLPPKKPDAPQAASTSQTATK